MDTGRDWSSTDSFFCHLVKGFTFRPFKNKTKQKPKPKKQNKKTKKQKKKKKEKKSKYHVKLKEQ